MYSIVYLDQVALSNLTDHLLRYIDENPSSVALAMISDTDIFALTSASIAVTHNSSIIGICGRRRSPLFSDLFITVADDSRSQGIGNILLTNFLQNCSHKKLYLFTYANVTYASAIRLYRRHNFKKIATYREHILMMHDSCSLSARIELFVRYYTVRILSDIQKLIHSTLV